MPRSTFVQQDFFLTVLAVYGATIAFSRHFPNADLIAVDAHPASIAEKFKSSSEYALALYTVSLVVDIVRILALAVLESTAFSFAFSEDRFEPFSYAFLVLSMVMVTKDLLLVVCQYALPEISTIAAAKAVELMPISAILEQGLVKAGAVSLIWGLYQWTFAIGRDKRQVIEKVEKVN
ncbi:hypothetical protein BGZ83_006035 [Gryganskiella cystojenkinii]|nr:hypothetical protein BGZ83_006035 [Gryganskiella cystojenkinii]